MQKKKTKKRWFTSTTITDTNQLATGTAALEILDAKRISKLNETKLEQDLGCFWAPCDATSELSSQSVQVTWFDKQGVVYPEIN